MKGAFFDEVQLAKISSSQAFLYSWAWQRVRIWDSAGFTTGATEHSRIQHHAFARRASEHSFCLEAIVEEVLAAI